MSKIPRVLPLLAVLLLQCYHATIETGLPPSVRVLERWWASGWILGLVPPKTVETAAKCPGGVSRIDTQLSFLNQLVGFLTLYIYTPMDIRVTCAGSSTSFDPSSAPTVRVPASASGVEAQTAVAQAVTLSSERSSPVFVVFER